MHAQHLETHDSLDMGTVTLLITGMTASVLISSMVRGTDAAARPCAERFYGNNVPNLA